MITIKLLDLYDSDLFTLLTNDRLVTVTRQAVKNFDNAVKSNHVSVFMIAHFPRRAVIDLNVFREWRSLSKINHPNIYIFLIMNEK